MSRPKSKSELLDQSQNNYNKLLEHIREYGSDENKHIFPEGMLNRNIRDVIGHLYEWHLMMLTWYEIGMKGEKPDMPAKGYTWKTTPALNKEIQKKYTKYSFDKILKLFNGTHQQLTRVIESHTNEELFEKKHYKWTGSTSLGAYLISATASHYAWAFKLIRKALS